MIITITIVTFNQKNFKWQIKSKGVYYNHFYFYIVYKADKK